MKMVAGEGKKSAKFWEGSVGGRFLRRRVQGSTPTKILNTTTTPTKTKTHTTHTTHNTHTTIWPKMDWPKIGLAKVGHDPPGGLILGAPARSLEFDLLLVRRALREGGSAGRPSTQFIARKVYPDLQDNTPWMKEGMTIWENWCLQRKRERNNQGKDPRNCEGNSQGRDPGTQVRNRQGEDPRTLEKAVKVGTSVLAQHTASK